MTPVATKLRRRPRRVGASIAGRLLERLRLSCGGFGLRGCLRRGPLRRRACTRAQRKTIRPSSRAAIPPMISGPDHGAELSSGQVIETWLGAGFLPSDMMITETSFGTLIVRISCVLPLNSSTQRSEPTGDGAVDSLPLDELAGSSFCVVGLKPTRL